MRRVPSYLPSQLRALLIAWDLGRALAQFYSLLAQDKARNPQGKKGPPGGSHILSRKTIDAATTKVSDLFGGGYGLGFNLSSAGATVPGQEPGTFGHGLGSGRL